MHLIHSLDIHLPSDEELPDTARLKQRERLVQRLTQI